MIKLFQVLKSRNGNSFFLTQKTLGISVSKYIIMYDSYRRNDDIQENEDYLKQNIDNFCRYLPRKRHSIFDWNNNDREDFQNYLVSSFEQMEKESETLESIKYLFCNYPYAYIKEYHLDFYIQNKYLFTKKDFKHLLESEEWNYITNKRLYDFISELPDEYDDE